MPIKGIGNFSVSANFSGVFFNESFAFFVMYGYPANRNLKICPEITVGKIIVLSREFFIELINLVSNDVFPSRSTDCRN